MANDAMIDVTTLDVAHEERNARATARDFAEWVKSRPQPTVGGKIKFNGFATLLRIGRLLISIFKSIAAAAASRIALQVVKIAGMQFGVIVFDATAVDPAAGLSVTAGGFVGTVRKA